MFITGVIEPLVTRHHKTTDMLPDLIFLITLGLFLYFNQILMQKLILL